MQTRDLRVSLGTILLLEASLCAVALGRTIYVDADSTGANNGSNWVDAYRYLQDALADANTSPKPAEIRVAQGIYKPDQGAGVTSGDRMATFQLINGVSLRGGYAGTGAPDPNTRNINDYKTILSGDLEGNDVRVSAPHLWSPASGRLENSYHVVTGNGTDPTAILDGFTITAGHDNRVEGLSRNSRYVGFGGGMGNESGSPTVTNCLFIGNWAGRSGGAIHNYKSSPMFKNCTFSGNFSWLMGGGMYNAESSPTVANCIFTGNSVVIDGGGIANSENSNARVSNCTFSGNRANSGGAISNDSSKLLLANCTFVGNYNALGCTAFEEYLSSVQATNCIFWDGAEEIWNNPPGTTIKITYCNVQGRRTRVYDPCEGLVWGLGNIDADPYFVDPGYWDDPCNTPDKSSDDVWIDGDYHLKSQAGRWDSNEGRWTSDDVTSPCIDAGDPNTPVGDEPFPNGGIINMGAYGGTAEASKSYFGEPVCETIIASDINGDCKVDFKDFQLMALHWLE